MARMFLILLFSPLLSQAYVINCDALLPGSANELSFQLFSGRDDDTQNVMVSVGQPHNWKSVNVPVIQNKESTGILSHNVVYQSGNRFRLTNSAGIRNSGAGWKLSANLPEIGLVMQPTSINCMSYH